MDKELNIKRVEGIVASIMDKLAIKNSIEYIVERYKRTHIFPFALAYLDIKEKEPVVEPDIPECAKMVYFQWDDVLASMYTMPEKVTITETVCPHCGEKLIELYFSSPSWTWEALCGRSGYMTICQNCPRQVDFCLVIMN